MKIKNIKEKQMECRKTKEIMKKYKEMINVVNKGEEKKTIEVNKKRNGNLMQRFCCETKKYYKSKHQKY